MGLKFSPFHDGGGVQPLQKKSKGLPGISVATREREKFTWESARCVDDMPRGVQSLR